ncbi:uncharacterized protein G2W53_004076 [Senna tora]|uniref:Uncharacterized protein n=1 Tax=Senna tora TaxID=362788 RepID=A0A834X9T7_9FABA|nr:uncharacterized protein G2W53_004076 [Senna tora]
MGCINSKRLVAGVSPVHGSATRAEHDGSAIVEPPTSRFPSEEIGVWVERRGVSVFGGVGYGIGKGMEDWKGWRGGSRFEGGVVQFWGRLEGGWGLGFGLREGEWFGFGEGCEGGWVTVLVRKRDTVWWGCYGGVAMEVEVVGKKKKRLERERGRFWGERRKKGF